MTTRRSRPSRSRKSQAPPPEPRRDDVGVDDDVRVAATFPSDLPPMPPSFVDELALLDAGWDSLDS